jgi:hypothetical protein
VTVPSESSGDASKKLARQGRACAGRGAASPVQQPQDNNTGWAAAAKLWLWQRECSRQVPQGCTTRCLRLQARSSLQHRPQQGAVQVCMQLLEVGRRHVSHGCHNALQAAVGMGEGQDGGSAEEAQRGSGVRR